MTFWQDIWNVLCTFWMNCILILTFLFLQELITHPRTRQQPLSSGWTPLEPETPPISPPLNSLLNHVSSTAPRNLLHPTPWSSAEVSPYQQHQQTTKSFKQETNVRINNFGSQTLSHARHVSKIKNNLL